VGPQFAIQRTSKELRDKKIFKQKQLNYTAWYDSVKLSGLLNNTVSILSHGLSMILRH